MVVFEEIHVGEVSILIPEGTTLTICLVESEDIVKKCHCASKFKVSRVALVQYCATITFISANSFIPGKIIAWNLHTLRPIKEDCSTSHSRVISEGVVDKVWDWFGFIILFVNFDSTTPSLARREVLKSRIDDSNEWATTASEAMTILCWSRIVHMHFLKSNFWINSTDVTFASIRKGRFCYRHRAQLDLNVRLHVVLEVSLIDKDVARVLQWNGLSSRTDRLIVLEDDIVRDMDAAKGEPTENSLIQGLEVADLRIVAHRDRWTEEQAKEATIKLWKIEGVGKTFAKGHRRIVERHVRSDHGDSMIDKDSWIVGKCRVWDVRLRTHELH